MRSFFKERLRDPISGKRASVGDEKTANNDSEMKNASGKLHDYLNELVGNDSSDKETARKTADIDLPV